MVVAPPRCGGLCSGIAVVLHLHDGVGSAFGATPPTGPTPSDQRATSHDSDPPMTKLKESPEFSTDIQGAQVGRASSSSQMISPAVCEAACKKLVLSLQRDGELDENAAEILRRCGMLGPSKVEMSETCAAPLATQVEAAPPMDLRSYYVAVLEGEMEIEEGEFARTYPFHKGTVWVCWLEGQIQMVMPSREGGLDLWAM